MKCKYCGSEWGSGNKFYTVDCCIECHIAGRDRDEFENDDEFINKHRD